MRSATVIVPTVSGGERLRACLDSLAGQSADHELIVVDNGSVGDTVSGVCDGRPQVQAVRLEANAGFSRAVNLGARRASGDAIVLVNDDCRCDPGFVESIVGALDPDRGIVMAAGVMRDGGAPTLIDTAGIELDHTLLGFDYLNGCPVATLDAGVGDPIAPSGAAAAYDRAAFLAVDGFDERLFAYWEDVDLGLRMLREGGRCAIAAGARGTHHHSATLGSGSPRKNYLMGFGRGYVLRKWGVTRSPRRAAAVLARDSVLCAGQLVHDRNAAGLRGRVSGYRSAAPAERYPREIGLGRRSRGGLISTLRRHGRRRARVRRASRARAG
jgi:N-acetylglucosaminyl-diphospho-decaprenol L-rhamnosyltransferase